MAKPPISKSKYNKGYGDSASTRARQVFNPRTAPAGARGDPFTQKQWTKYFAPGGLGYTPTGRGAPAPVAAPQGGAGGAFVMPDWKDATYNKMMDLLAQQESNLRLQKGEAQKTALIRLGSRSLAEKILGSGDPALAGISDNPDTSLSTLAQIAREGRQLVGDVNDMNTDRSTWFSSTRANDLTRAAYEEQKATTTATQDFQDFYGKLGNDLQAALQEITFGRMSAESEAQQRAIQLWLLGGGGTAPPGAGGVGAPMPQTGRASPGAGMMQLPIQQQLINSFRMGQQGIGGGPFRPM